MTSRADFSDEEWEVLVLAPLLACWAVIAAAPTGAFGTVGELQAMIGHMNDTRREADTQSVLGGLAASLRHRLNRSELRVQELPKDVVRQRALEAAREAMALLAAREATDQAAPYRDWIIGLATTVADGSKEGGGLSAGDQVRPQESTLIDELRRALEQGTVNG